MLVWHHRQHLSTIQSLPITPHHNPRSRAPTAPAFALRRSVRKSACAWLAPSTKMEQRRPESMTRCVPRIEERGDRRCAAAVCSRSQLASAHRRPTHPPSLPPPRCHQTFHTFTKKETLLDTYDYAMYGKVRGGGVKRGRGRRGVLGDWAPACGLAFPTIFCSTRLITASPGQSNHLPPPTPRQVFKYGDTTAGGATKLEIYFSFGGLLMKLVGDPSKLKVMEVDSTVYLLIRRL
jgi:hypothetical protein